jgi:apolipoprotein N-acyltransferase
MIRKKVEIAKAPRIRPAGPIPSIANFSGVLSLVGGVLLWSAFPPLGLDWCAWLAPIPWLLLAGTPGPSPRRFYLKIWVAAVLHWLVMLWGITLAHPANILGWLALSLYLAAYLPLFIALARSAVHGARVPLLLAAPMIWTGLELLRGYLFTGFAVALLGHTQVNHVGLIQIADLTGAYGVSFLIMLGAACGTEALQFRGKRDPFRTWLPVAAFASVLLATIGYGWWRTHAVSNSSEKPLRVALLQGTRDKVFEYNEELDKKAFEQYRGLMQRAREAYLDLDLIVWPESAFTGTVPEFLVDGQIQPPANVPFSPEEFRSRIEFARQVFGSKTRDIAAEANLNARGSQVVNGNTQLIVGVSTLEFQGNRRKERNTVLQLDPSGQIRGRYYKMHPVMFGEYIPFGRTFPWLYSLTPMQQGLTPGDAPAVFKVSGYRLAPSVCFESAVPHVIRGHVRRLKAEGESADILVNVSDDGWFWGSSILDYQFAGGVFRAVELRRPFLVAANTGITAAIDGNGRVLDQLPRRTEGVAFAEIHRDGRVSPYERFGDVFGGACLVATLWFGRPRFRKRKQS